jgi:phosphoglycerate kinase
MKNGIKTVDNVAFDGKKALIRVDFNVPLDANFNVTDDTRITSAVPTIKKILSDGGAVILMSHLGRPKSGPEDKFSLKHIVTDLNNALGLSVTFVGDCIGDEVAEAVAALNPGEVLLLENLRFYKEEEKGDRDFAEKLALLHRHSAEKFGLDHDNYIGSLPQSNSQTEKWSEFFISRNKKLRSCFVFLF